MAQGSSQEEKTPVFSFSSNSVIILSRVFLFVGGGGGSALLSKRSRRHQNEGQYSVTRTRLQQTLEEKESLEGRNDRLP